jgi:hypothetical protein
MLATALHMTETQIDAMTWDHYRALVKHWRHFPPVHVQGAVYLGFAKGK